jgi:hypothetical protein
MALKTAFFILLVPDFVRKNRTTPVLLDPLRERMGGGQIQRLN